MTWDLQHNKANYRVVLSIQDFVLLEDVGPHDEWLTVTNAADVVVRELVSQGKLQLGQRLFYVDSMNQMDEIEFNVVDGFQRFVPINEKDEVAKTCLGAWNQMQSTRNDIRKV
jgi:hypothetical protein